MQSYCFVVLVNFVILKIKHNTIKNNYLVKKGKILLSLVTRQLLPRPLSLEERP